MKSFSHVTLPAARILAAGSVVLALLTGCSAIESITQPSAQSEFSSGTGKLGSESNPIQIKDPIGPCKETATTVDPPADNEELCTYRRMVVGHAVPKKGATYLSRIASKIKEGSNIEMNGRLWSVTDVSSIPKESLPQRMYDKKGSERYIVTCDTKSGYTRWSDGIMHSRNNLVFTLKPIKASAKSKDSDKKKESKKKESSKKKTKSSAKPKS